MFVVGLICACVGAVFQLLGKSTNSPLTTLCGAVITLIGGVMLIVNAFMI